MPSSSISMKLFRALNLFRNKMKLRNDRADDNVLLQTVTPTLPDHILMEEILPRLPVKYLITFKLVSKQWNHTISSYTFAKSHLKFAYSFDQFFLINPRSNLFCDWDHFFYLLRYNECSSVNELVGIDVSVSFMFPTLVGCCNGLVCFTYQKGRTSCFCLWNPATRECRDISNPGGVMFALAYGFGYVSSIDDYKIFSSFGSKTDQCPVFFVFSWREGRWRSINNGLDEDVGKHLLLNSVWIDDTLFWPPNPSSESIVGFNFVSERLEVYPMMIWSSCVYLGMDLHRFDGCLALFGHKDDEASDFWVLKKHDDWSSWEKLFTVNLRHVSLINFSETGKCLVRHFDQLKLVDVCKEALERVRGDFNFSPMVKTGNYIESLISPYGTTMSDDEELS